ncbi:MAG: BtpA/SgcQ family protein [Firmicutes bacterium]|nr:BtpA/SgcQ family protein [Bacillota bacterium]
MWTEELFHVKKPIIAMLHLRALPGDPLYPKDGSIDQVIAWAREELTALQDGGVDGVLIANEFSLPYEKKASYLTVASMACIIGAIKRDIRVPFGVNIANNAIATIDLAAATGAAFARNAFTGAYAGRSGILDTDVAEALRRKKYLDLDELKLFFKANPEGTPYITDIPLKENTKSIVFMCNPDALCASGSGAGQEADDQILIEMKAAAGDVPVFANTGCKASNICRKLDLCDGAIVGTALKKDGRFENFTDYERVKEFMDIVKEYRRKL